MAGRVKNDDLCPANVSEARSRFDLFSDHNLATRMQQSEFDEHFDANRSERRLVGSDTRTSRTVQMSEAQRAEEERRRQMRHIELSDEEIARRLQAELEAEAANEEQMRIQEKRQREMEDEAIARALQEQESGRIVGYGNSNMPRAEPMRRNASYTEAQSQVSAETQNALNDRLASTVPSRPPPPRVTPIPVDDPFSTEDERRAAAYAPSHAVPLIHPPPLSSTVPPVSRPFPLPGLAQLQPQYVQPPQQQNVLIEDLPSPPLPTPPSFVMQSDMASTNPFLPHLLHSTSVPIAVSNNDYRSEFGLPPPSSLAMGMRSLQTQPPPYPPY